MKEKEIKNSIHSDVRNLSDFVGMECAWREGSMDFREVKWLNSSVSEKSKRQLVYRHLILGCDFFAMKN